MNDQLRTSVADGLRIQIFHGDEQYAIVGQELEPFTVRVSDAVTGQPVAGCSIDFVPTGALRREDEIEATNEYGMASATFVAEAGGPFTVGCWVTDPSKGTANIGFTGTVTTESERARTLPYTEVASAAMRHAMTGGELPAERSTFVTTIKPIGGDEPADEDRLTDEDIDAELFPVDVEPIKDATELLLESAARASAVSHPDEAPTAPVSHLYRKIALAVVAAMACVLLWQNVPNLLAQQPSQAECGVGQKNGKMVYVCKAK